MMDIYDDLDNYNEEINKEALQSENQELKSKLQEYEGKLQKLQMDILQDYDNLEAKHKTLLQNFSALLKTARAEIERKTQTITQINAEKDQMILRLVNNGNNKGVHHLRKSNNFNKRNSIDTVDTARDSPRVSPIVVQKPLKNEEKTLEPTKVPSESLIQKHEPSRDLRNIPDLRNKENQNTTAPMRIRSRRKSMPAFRCEDPKFSEEEGEIDGQTDKHRIDTETAKSSAPSSIDDRLLDARDIERPRSSNEIRERLRGRFEERKDIKFSGRSRRSRERELIEFKERAFKRSHSGHRLETPPSDRYNRNKSRDRRSGNRAREDYERRLHEEKRFNEEQRVGEDKHRGEERRLDEDKRKSNKKLIGNERRIDEERCIGEERPMEAERRGTDERNSKETRRGGEKNLNDEIRENEERRKSEQRRLEKDRRMANKRSSEEQSRRGDEKSLIDDQRRMDEERRKSQQSRMDEVRRKSEQRRIAEERRKADEERRLDEERLKSEQRRIEEEIRKVDEERRLEEERRKSEQRRIEDEKRKAVEERRLDEERLKSEQRRIEEEIRKVDEERRRADEKRMLEQRIDEEKRIDEERRKDEERRMEEERRSNEEKRKHDERMGVERQSRELREKRRVEEIRLCEERRLSQERRSIEHQKKPTLHDEDRELNAKRRKVENVTENYSRWGHSYDSLTLPFKTSCQSPDDHFVDRSSMGHDIKEIKLTAHSKLEDPRFHCNRYVQVTDNRNKPVLASKSGIHVDLQILEWNQVKKPEKHVEIPKDLIEPPKEMRLPDLSEQQVKDIYTSIDENNHDVSMESGEINGDVPEDVLLSSALTETAKKLNKNHKSESGHSYDSNTEHKLQKYKIPKKTTIDPDVSQPKERPLDLLYKHYQALEQIAATQRPQDVSKSEKPHKKHSQDSALREMVEGDLALSDDDLSIGNITENDSVENNKTKENKESKEKNKNHKDKIKTRNKKTKEERKEKPGTNKTQNNDIHIEDNKYIKAKFSDLFGDSSLLTPEDLNLPSEPTEADNCLLAMSENANFVGENESWSITAVPDDLVSPYKNPTGNLRTYSSKKKVKKEQKKISPKTDSPTVTKVKSKDSIQNVTNDSEHFKNENVITLLPKATVADDDGVIKTVIISSGVQLPNVVEPSIVSPELQQAAVQTENVSTQHFPVVETVQIPEVHTALATSTPSREYSSENVSVSNDSNSFQNLSNNQSRSASGTPDLKIILRRRKRF